jgi:hypothetical protein
LLSRLKAVQRMLELPVSMARIMEVDMFWISPGISFLRCFKGTRVLIFSVLP